MRQKGHKNPINDKKVYKKNALQTAREKGHKRENLKRAIEVIKKPE